MTRYAPDQKAKTRARIIRSAARLFREKGFAASGIDAVMKAAGLTHGGFYAHFGSKQELFAAAVDAAVRTSADTLEEGLDELSPIDWLRQVVIRYLSKQHLDNAKSGCPLPSMTPEIQRAPIAVRRAFHAAGECRFEAVTERFAAIGANDPRGEAIAMFGALAGTMSMARSIPDAEAAEEILDATRSRWLERIDELGANN